MTKLLEPYEQAVAQATSAAQKIDALNDLAWHSRYLAPVRTPPLCAEIKQLCTQAPFADAAYELGLAHVLTTETILHVRNLELSEAMDKAFQSQAILERLDEPKWMPRILNNLGIIYGMQSLHADAQRYHERQLALSQALGDKAMEAGAIHNLMRAPNFVETETVNMARALALFTEVQLYDGIVFSYMSSSERQIEQGNFVEGIRLATEGFEMAEQYELDSIKSFLLEMLATASAGLGKLDDAETYYRRSVAVAKALGSAEYVVSSLLMLADFCFDQNKPDDALIAYEEAQAVLEEKNHVRLQLQLNEGLAKYWKQMGAFEQSLQHTEACLALKNDMAAAQQSQQADNFAKLRQLERQAQEAELLRLRTVELERLVEVRTADVLKALEQSEKTNGVRRNIIDTISHEFRTPLTVINSASALLKRYGQTFTVDRRTQLHDRITGSVEYLAQLLDDVAQVDDDISYALAPSYSRVVAGALSQQLASHLQAATDNPINVTYRFCSLSTLTFDTDIEMVRDISAEMLTNAIKYTPPDKPITVEIQVDDACLSVTVADEGVGIAADELDDIYNLFYRANNTAGVLGLGTGLYKAKAMATILGGDITVASPGIGHGSTFTLRLPLTKASL